MPQCCGLVRTLQVSIEHWQHWGQLGLGIDHLIFKRGYGWFQRKISGRLIVREKNLARNTWQKKKFLHWKYNVRVMLEIKSCTVVCQEKKFCHQRLGKKFLPKPNQPNPPPPSQPQPPFKSQMVGQWLQAIERLNLQPKFFTRGHWHIINGYVMVICNGYLPILLLIKKFTKLISWTVKTLDQERFWLF